MNLRCSIYNLNTIIVKSRFIQHGYFKRYIQKFKKSKDSQLRGTAVTNKPPRIGNVIVGAYVT